MAFHEKHASKFNTLRSYIVRYAKPSVSFEMEVYLSGLIQAYGLEIAIRAQRCAKPKSFGTLYWQLNDAWPSISWSSIDYYGRWKPLQYLAKRYFKDIILFFHPSSSKFIAINDKLVPIKAKYNIKVMRFDGLVIH
jgi:beta-mannosidase